jgi:uncharacterized surface protein with fasciclin (FAS1) repeats
MKRYGIYAILVMAFLSAPAFAQCSCDSHDKPQAMAKSMDIVDTAVKAGAFNTLVTAVKAAGLVEALKGKGPFTVFAPTDEAFSKVCPNTLASLLKPENRDKLTAILTYHVVPGKVMAKDVVKIKGASSLNGQQIGIKVSEESVFVDNAKVIKTDIRCSNGIIHVIDSVIMPSFDDIVATAVKAESFKTLVTAVKAAKLVSALQGKGPFTVFAPTDEAFAKLPAELLEDLLKPENREKLIAVLTYHVVPSRVYSQSVGKITAAETLQKGKIRFSTDAGGARVNNAKILATDIDASNGVIHVIDTVLIPPTFHHGH